jgi:hypothetical protein
MSDERPRERSGLDPESDRVPAIRGPVQGLADLAELFEDRPASATFIRGVVVGALVGAAIAGSAIWQRRRRRPPAPRG